MPTVLRRGGFRVVIFTDDHEPMHVHVFNADGEVVINLGEENDSPVVRENRRMRGRDGRRALALVEDNQERLRAEWRRIHG